MSRSPYTAGLKWEPGHLNDSGYAACTKFAAKVLNCHPPGALLKEIADLIEAAGDAADKGKLIKQFAAAFSFVANERACDALNAPEFKIQRVRGSRSEGKWPAPDPELIESIGRENARYTLASWQNRQLTADLTPGDILSAIFPGGSLVCFGTQQNMHFIRPLGDELYRRALTAQFVVPNPAKDYYVEFPDGRRSLKCDQNFPQRRFVIIEFERKFIDPTSKRSLAEILDLQSALHAHIAQRTGSLVLLAYSGNKSVHAWHHCESWDEAKVIDLLRYTSRLGGDHSFSSPSQFTRMPFGRHVNGTKQTVHFFNP